MEEFSRGRPDGKPSDPGEGGAAVRTPSKGDSSSPALAPPSDSPTLIDIPGHSVIPGHGASVLLRFSDDGGHSGWQFLGFADHGGPSGPRLSDHGRCQSVPGKSPAADAKSSEQPVHAATGRAAGAALRNPANPRRRWDGRGLQGPRPRTESHGGAESDPAGAGRKPGHH